MFNICNNRTIHQKKKREGGREGSGCERRKKSQVAGVSNPGFPKLGKSNNVSKSWLFHMKMELVKRTYSIHNESALAVSDNAMHTESAQ